MNDTNYVSTLYVGLLDRAPDLPGLDFWSDASEKSELLVTDAFLDFSGLGDDSNSDFIDALYWNLFEREADSGGMAYWTGRLADGASRAEVTQAIINGADGLDELVMDQKAFVGRYYAERIDASEHPYSLSESQEVMDLYVRPDLFASDAISQIGVWAQDGLETGVLS